MAEVLLLLLLFLLCVWKERKTDAREGPENDKKSGREIAEKATRAATILRR